MSRLHINIGDTANDRTGDPLRTAFDKVNQNFIELYATASADVQIPAQTNNGGKFLTTNGTTLSWTNISQEVGTANTGFVDNRIYNLNGPTLSNDDLVHGATARLSLPAYGESSDISLLNYYGPVSVFTGFNPSNTVGWQFGQEGTLTAPAQLNRSFLAVLDTEHMYPQPGIAFDGAPWEIPVTFETQPDGTVNTIIEQIFPILTNPGYVSGHSFRFEVADHNIPGFTFDLILNNVTLPGGAGWTANLAVTQPPEYYSTLDSSGPIKLTANASSFVLGTDGTLTLPTNGDIIKNGVSVLGTSTGNITFDNDAISNSIIDQPIVLKTSKNTVGGSETATNSNPTPSNVFFGYLGFTPTINNVQVGWTVSGDGLVGTKTVTDVALGGFENGYWTITVDGGDGSVFTYNGSYTFSQTSATVINQWNFSENGVLTLPANGDIVNSAGTSVLGTPTVIDGGNASTAF